MGGKGVMQLLGTRDRETIEQEKKSEVCLLKTFQLEEENFRIDSSGWKRIHNKQNIVYLENPEGDIWEYVGGVKKELIGQQLFSWSAAMRETEKVGRKIPTNDQFNLFKREDFGGKILYTGCHSLNDVGDFCSFGTYTYFWSSSVSDLTAWSCHLYSDYPTVLHDLNNQVHGFSVRCLV